MGATIEPTNLALRIVHKVRRIPLSPVFIFTGLICALAIGYILRRFYWPIYESIGTYPGDIWYIHTHYGDILRQKVFFQIEYPAGLFLYFKLTTYLTMLFSKSFSYEAFLAVNTFFLSAFALGTTWLIWKLIPLVEPKPATWKVWVFWAVAPSMFFYALLNFDMPVVFLTVLAVYFRFKGNEDWSAAALGLGVVLKIYPIILIPLFLLGKKPRDAIRYCVVAGGVWLLVNSSFMLLDFKAWAFPYIWQTTREPTTDGLVWLIWKFLGTKVATFFFPLLYVATFGIILKRVHKSGILGSTAETRVLLLGFTAAVLGSFLLANRIFSPQYILWLLPLLVFIPRISPLSFYVFDIPNVVLTLLLFGFMSMSNHPNIRISFMVIRYMALILLYVQALLVRQSVKKEITGVGN